MNKIYAIKNFLLTFIVAFSLFAASCHKNPTPTPIKDTTVVVTPTPTKVGLYELDSSVYKLLVIAVSKVGNSTIDYGLIFDTGSGGMVMDADSVIPKSMITPTGFNFTGDSVVVNGITITNQTDMIEYGADSATYEKVYGNLAYAPVTIGDSTGKFVIKRLPFFLYYKAVDNSGKTLTPHEFDTFGVADEYDVAFASGINITSPFTFFEPGTGLTKGFRIAAVGLTNFSRGFSYLPNAVGLGLTVADLSSNGFILHPLSFFSGAGYPALTKATVTYNGKAFSTRVLFDTGTEPYSYLEDPTYSGAFAQLPDKSPISIVTTSGFSYSYTTSATENITNIENPNTTGGSISIIGLEYFINNEFLLDFTNHQMGLKNN